MIQYGRIGSRTKLAEGCVFRAALATISVRGALGAANLAQEFADLALDLS